MKREILFRGKRPNSGKWIQGYLFEKDGFSWILSDRFSSPECSCEVIPETVGQFTGLTDKNGVKIFEGDILMSYDCGEQLGTNIVFWDEQRCGWSDKRDDGDSQTNYDGFDFVTECKVIGNIHYNP